MLFCSSSTALRAFAVLNPASASFAPTSACSSRRCEDAIVLGLHRCLGLIDLVPRRFQFHGRVFVGAASRGIFYGILGQGHLARRRLLGRGAGCHCQQSQAEDPGSFLFPAFMCASIKKGCTSSRRLAGCTVFRDRNGPI